MTKHEAVREFKTLYSSLYEKGADYWTAQLAWSEYTDMLCKEKRITAKQWSNWTTPFPYGKPLRKRGW